MTVQLPAEAQGAAAGVLTYSVFSLMCILCLLWLIWVHSERACHVAMLSLFVALNCLASIIQQIHTMGWWNDVKTEQYHYVVANVGHPEIAIAGPSVGLDLALFYIQNYTYNVNAMVFMFWALELTCSVYHFRLLKKAGPHASLGAKIFAVLLPVVHVGLLKSKAVQSSLPAFLFVHNFIVALSILGGCGLLLAILYRYVMTKRAFMSWNVGYGKSESTGEMEPHNGAGPAPPRQSIYDGWLVVRFSIAFLALCIFQAFTIFFQIHSFHTNRKETLPDHADLSASRARRDFIFFMPGVSTGFLVFVVFGTTRTFRDYLLRALVPRKIWQRKQANRPATAPTTSGIMQQPMGRPPNSSTYHLEVCPDQVSGQGSPTPEVYERNAGSPRRNGAGAVDHGKEAWKSDKS